jgi:hypothetical protein
MTRTWLSRNLVPSLINLLLIGLLGLFMFTSALAQTGRSTVQGTVRDPQGSVVTGATVTLINEGKNINRTQTTNQDGGYVFTAVPPGTYKLEIEASGFKKLSIATVEALVDTPVTVDSQLEVGSISEVISVTSNAEAPLNTTDASIGTAFESRRIQALPLNARNVIGLLSLQPGVTRDGYVSGGRKDQANITLDGIDVNEQQRGLDVVTDEAFASVLRSTPDSLQEFRVTTTKISASSNRSTTR